MKLEETQPGALVERRSPGSGDPRRTSKFLDLITHVTYVAGRPDNTICFRSGDFLPHSEHERLAFLGNIRQEPGDIELGPQIRYVDPLDPKNWKREPGQERAISLTPAEIEAIQPPLSE